MSDKKFKAYTEFDGYTNGRSDLRGLEGADDIEEAPEPSLRHDFGPHDMREDENDQDT